MRFPRYDDIHPGTKEPLGSTPLDFIFEEDLVNFGVPREVIKNTYLSIYQTLEDVLVYFMHTASVDLEILCVKDKKYSNTEAFVFTYAPHHIKDEAPPLEEEPSKEPLAVNISFAAGVKRVVPAKAKQFIHSKRLRGIKFSMRVTLFEDDTVANVDIIVNNDYSANQAARLVGKAINIGLKYGVPLREFCDLYVANESPYNYSAYPQLPMILSEAFKALDEYNAGERKLRQIRATAGDNTISVEQVDGGVSIHSTSGNIDENHR